MFFLFLVQPTIFYLTSLIIAFKLLNYEVVALSPQSQWYCQQFADNVPKSMTVKHGPFSVRSQYEDCVEIGDSK